MFTDPNRVVESHLSAAPTVGDISYDLVMEAEMGFVEGAYRMKGQDWQVFVFSARDIAEPEWRFCQWDSGVGGVVVRYPRATILNQHAVEQILSIALNVAHWTRVQGPDSMQLR